MRYLAGLVLFMLLGCEEPTAMELCMEDCAFECRSQCEGIWGDCIEYPNSPYLVACVCDGPVDEIDGCE